MSSRKKGNIKPTLAHIILAFHFPIPFISCKELRTSKEVVKVIFLKIIKQIKIKK
jgi:hypothetical protein